jgi:hypothetical protein
MPRFVILLHTFPDSNANSLTSASTIITPIDLKQSRPRETHWDWMFECDGELWTWATRPLVHLDDLLNSPTGIPAQRLPNHRLLYLNYSGPVSDDRGNVEPRFCGEYTRVPTSEKFPAPPNTVEPQEHLAQGKPRNRRETSLPFQAHVVVQDSELRFWVNFTDSQLIAGLLD